MEHLNHLLGTSETPTSCCGRDRLFSVGRLPKENRFVIKQSDEGSAAPA
jgi:hypothetical protein